MNKSSVAKRSSTGKKSPSTTNNTTVTTPSSGNVQLGWGESFARWVVFRYLRDLVRVGRLEIREPSGSIEIFAGTEKVTKKEIDSCVTISVNRPAFYTKLATRFDLGLSEAYMDGDIDFSPSIEAFLTLVIANRDHPDNRVGSGGQIKGMMTAGFSTTLAYWMHLSRSNSVDQTRENISRHYDLSNDMFALFLDPTMTYSCGVFNSPSDSLEQSQINKLGRLIEKARISGPDDHVLEIGFGWGSMSRMAVKKYGCRWTGLTQSTEQMEWAQDLAKKEGLDHLITYKVADYRTLEVEEKFDRVISCEMIEAVGHEYLGEYFGTCEKLMKDDGLLVIQAITCPEERYEAYRNSTDFINTYIFPGGLCPSFEAMTTAVTKNTSLTTEHVENIGPYYARTLNMWRDAFLANKEKILALDGFDERFIRMWNYYFDYCSAGFRTRTINTLQIVWSKPGNTTAMTSLDNPYLHL